MTEKKPKGFAAMTPEARRKIAALGGKTAHQTGKAHQFTPLEAAAAGRKGGLATKKPRQTTPPAALTKQPG